MSLFDLFSADPAQDAARAQRQGQWRGRNASFRHLNEASDTLKDHYGQAGEALAPMSAQYNQLFEHGGGYRDMHADAMGLNGPGGRARALQSFEASPGSEYVLGETNEAIKQQQASLGMLNSGNTLTALSDYNRNHFANEQWNPWLDRLGATGAQYSQVDPTPAMRAQQLTGLGDQLAGVKRSKANIDMNTHLGIGDAWANHHMAGTYAGANTLNAIMGGATAAAKAYGGAA